ncbi:MAG: squalene/phytoene synthase family protein [Chloroflexota bacterium]
MSTTPEIPIPRKSETEILAAAITKASSKQTYYTFRWLVDRPLVADAYRAYAYFRWVDDALDGDVGTSVERRAFLERQEDLLEACYAGQAPGDACPEERMLVDLVAHDHAANSGLQVYLRNMMAVMRFDMKRRGRTISRLELAEYTRLLATAVTEVLHYFIGHNCELPCRERRYLAVQGAHVVHMLRDAVEDAQAGYFNVAGEYVEAHNLPLMNLDHPAYRKWVYNRVQLAHLYFDLGEQYLAQVKNLRCRLAGAAYVARFKYVLRLIEQDDYRLRAAYPERKSLRAGLWMAWTTLSTLFAWRKPGMTLPQTAPRVFRLDGQR